MKTTKTYSIDADLAQKFDEETPSRKTSQELENAMRDYLGEETSQDNNYLLDSIGFTEKQTDFLNFTLQQIPDNLEDGKEGVYLKISDLVKNCKQKGIYSNTESAKNIAKNLIPNNAAIPLFKKGSKLYLGRVDCECGNCFPLKIWCVNNGKCPHCEYQLIKSERFDGDWKANHSVRKPSFL